MLSSPSCRSRNSVCVLWANPTESKDTTKTAKDTWPEAKGCTQRLQVATPCVLKRPSVCVPLLCMGTTCRAWGRPAGLCTAGGLGGDSELRELPLQRLGSVGVQSLTKSEGLYGRVCRLAGGPYWKRFLPALPFSQCGTRHFQAGCLSRRRVFRARLVSTEQNQRAPREVSFLSPP